MLGVCRYPVSVCIAASVSGMNTTLRPDWKLDIRLERVLPFDRERVLPSCTGGNRAAPPEDCAGALAYLKRLDWHRSHPPLEELSLMAEAVRWFLDSDGDRQAIGDLDELREAIDRVEAYQDFQPGRFDRRALNRQLRLLAQDREVRR
jgi:Plasmid pRiA4b ORF-3-like protein